MGESGEVGEVAEQQPAPAPGGPTDAPPPPPPGATPWAGPRRVRRDTTRGMLGGVAAGLARHLDVDVVWVRLAFVLTTVFVSGFGLVAYVAAWIIIPAGDDAEAGAPGGGARTEPVGRGAAFWTGVGLVALGALLLLDLVLTPLRSRLGIATTGDIVLPLLLIVAGVLVWRAGRDRSGGPSGGHREGEGLGRRVERWTEEVEPRVEAWAERLDARAEAFDARLEERAAARSRSRVAPVTFGAALLTLGTMWLLATLGVAAVTTTRVLAATLLVLGVGLLVGAFRGRGRGLVATGLLLAPVVLVATVAPQLPGGFGALRLDDGGLRIEGEDARAVRPETLAALPGSYEFAAGRATVDLRALTPADVAAAGTTTLDVEFGAGELTVLLPEDVTVDVAVELGIGRVRIAGTETSGVGLDRRTVLDGGAGVLVVRIEQGVGTVTVSR